MSESIDEFDMSEKEEDITEAVCEVDMSEKEEDTTEAVCEVDMSEKEEDITEAICAICDNGGDVICCEGRCLRAFHATVEAGSDAACESLGFSKKQIKEIETFKCENCKYNKHQCYVCGKLGSSDISVGAEVFQCNSRTCGYFYHPSCVANALSFKYADVPKDTETEIASGKPFSCPLHFCYACNELESVDETDLLMQFAVCRRCPRAYHKKCLPGTISFEGDDDKGIRQRAWEDLIPNKILIYCMEHKIDDELLTPVRFHINFPNYGLKKEKQSMESVPGPRKRLRSLEDSRVPNLFRSTKKSSAAKQLKKSSSIQDMRFSGPYSLRDRKLLRKRNLLKKNRIGSAKHPASEKQTNENSEEIKLENWENCGLEKRSINNKGAAESNKAENLKYRKCLGSEKRTRISYEVLDNEHYEDMKLENRESSGSEKRSRSNGAVDDNASATKKYIYNGNEEPAKNMNSPGMTTHDLSSRSKARFMSSIGFATALCYPFSENSSAGWLNE